MEAPDYFRNIDPERISRGKAEETLLYIRYLLNREQDPAKISMYENLKGILEVRIRELIAQEEMLWMEPEPGAKPAELDCMAETAEPEEV